MHQQTINELINCSLNNDTNAFRQLVEAHQSFIYAVAFRILCSDTDSEEVVQDTFIKVWTNLHRFNNKMRFTTWLYKIVVNLCYDRLKTNKRYQNKVSFDIENSVTLNMPSPENIENKIINHELGQIIRFLTNELTPKQKLVFTLSELEELPVNEISVITGLSPGKIKSNLYCARQNIKDKLSKIEERRGKYEI